MVGTFDFSCGLSRNIKSRDCVPWIFLRRRFGMQHARLAECEDVELKFECPCNVANK